MSKCHRCIWYEDYEYESELVFEGCLKSSEPENCEEFAPAPIPEYEITEDS